MTISTQAALDFVWPKRTHLWRFARNDSGAITTDWVVLTAAIVGMAVALVGATLTGVVTLGQQVSSSLSDAELASLDGFAIEAAEDSDVSAPDVVPADPAVSEEEDNDPDIARGPIRLIDRGAGIGRGPGNGRGRAVGLR